VIGTQDEAALDMDASGGELALLQQQHREKLLRRGVAVVAAQQRAACRRRPLEPAGAIVVDRRDERSLARRDGGFRQGAAACFHSIVNLCHKRKKRR